MIKPFLVLCTLILIMQGCSSGPITDYQQRNLEVSGVLEAKKHIYNQVNYLKLLFQQSRDPYYGKAKWSQKCLRENQIGEIIEEKNYIYSISRLYFNQKGQSGHCPEDPQAQRGFLMMLYCVKSNVLKEIKSFQETFTPVIERICERENI